MKTILQISLACLACLSNLANANLLDIFKDPADLVINNNQCTYRNTREIEIIKGQILVKNTYSLGVIKKIDKDRILFKFDDSHDSFVLTLIKQNKEILAKSHSGHILFSCKVD